MERPDLRSVLISVAVIAEAIQLGGFTLPYAKQASANEAAQFHFSDEFKACRLERIQHNESYHPPEHPH